MRAVLLLALVALVAFAPAGVKAVAPSPQAPGGALQIGSVVPADLSFKDLDGKDRTFGELRGKVVFVHFWSIVCPSEKFAEPRFMELQKQFGDKVVQVALNANQRELKADTTPPYADLRDHVQKAGLTFMVGVDPGNKVTDALGGTNTPHCFVIDKDGKVRYSGALDDDPRGQKGLEARSYVGAAIQSLLDGKDVEVATTKPYG